MASSNNPVNQTSILLALGDELYKDIAVVRRDTTPKIYGDYAQVSAQRIELSSLLSYYGSQLGSMNPAMFQFLTQAQRIQVQKQLLFTLYLYFAQAKIDETEGRTRDLQNSIDGMNLCLKRLKELYPYLQETTDKKEEQLNQEMSESDNYLKFLGLTILAPWLSSKIMEFINQKIEQSEPNDSEEDKINNRFKVKDTELKGIAEGKKTKLMIDWMTQVNNRRLYWVWGGGMLASVLELMAFQGTLPASQIEQAQKGLGTPSPITGNMSWMLYYTRFGINLCLLLKHTINGPWMKPAEAAVPAWERFKSQWNQRKFTMLNDSIWATANMVCFFWLRGAGMLGYAGNILTAALLLMDLAISIWAFVEESSRHNAEMLAFEERKLALKEEIAKLNGKLEESHLLLKKLPDDQTGLKSELSGNIAAYKKKQAELEAELAHLQKIIGQSEAAWKYKKYGLITNMAYSAGLLFAFCLVCCFFFPPAALAPAAVLIMGFVGASLCFTLTILAAAVSGGLDISQTKGTIKDSRDECRALLVLFSKSGDDNTKKQLYLQMKGLMAESSYQEAMVKFQAIKLMRSVFIDAVIPAVVFASLVFMPLGIGLSVLAAGLAVALISYLIINSFEPKREDIKDLAEFKADDFLSEFRNFEQKLEEAHEGSIEDIEITDKQLVSFFSKPEQKSRYSYFQDSSSGNEAAGLSLLGTETDEKLKAQ